MKTLRIALLFGLLASLPALAHGNFYNDIYELNASVQHSGMASRVKSAVSSFASAARMHQRCRIHRSYWRRCYSELNNLKYHLRDVGFYLHDAHEYHHIYSLYMRVARELNNM